MGTTLQNGVYLPNEGERNCYAGLKTNWEILDQKVADVTALQQAVAGALHREIVESLPTTDIDPNTIYMILSGTSATENVYNEYMYVNNAWELIGTSATDLTNYYTKSEVDGKLLLKANASDLTSHTGDTTIHVTTADKNRWNNNTYVFRYSSTALVASSTNSNALLDNTDNLKVGDKVIDSSGVLFSITAIDTANSTFTIGTALVDLAQDSDVVHKSGNETVGGAKTFTDNISLKSLTADYGVTGGYNETSFYDKNSTRWSYLRQGIFSSGLPYVKFNLIGKDSNNQNIENSITYQYSTGFNCSYLLPTDNSVWLGNTSNRWSKIYGIQYYYGSNNVEFSTKFVTTDTNQTITGNKTFSNTIVLQGTTTPTVKTISNIIQDSTSGNETISRVVRDKTDEHDVFSESINKFSRRSVDYRLYITAINNDTEYTAGVRLIADPTNNIKSFISSGNNTVFLGNSGNRWKDFYTNKINALEPSSLSLPSDRSARIDISSYITNLGNGDNNQYIVPANGYIWLNFTSINGAVCYSQTSGGLTNYAQTFVRYQGDGQLYAFFPVRKDDRFVVQIYTSSTAVVQSAFFIPCQGNV